MSEQFSLNLEPKQPISPYDSMSQEDLEALYFKKFDRTPRIGRKDRDKLIWAIQNPEEDLDELLVIDQESDKADSPYNR